MVCIKDRFSGRVFFQQGYTFLSTPSYLVCPLEKQDFFEDDTLHVLVSKLLNCRNEQVSDKDTKLDVLAILANLVSAIFMID